MGIQVPAMLSSGAAPCQAGHARMGAVSTPAAMAMATKPTSSKSEWSSYLREHARLRATMTHQRRDSRSSGSRSRTTPTASRLPGSYAITRSPACR